MSKKCTWRKKGERTGMDARSVLPSKDLAKLHSKVVTKVGDAVCLCYGVLIITICRRGAALQHRPN